MNNRTCLATLLLFALWCTNAIAADDAKLQALLVENTHAITLKDGELSGPGLDLVMQLAKGTQFVALGEEHNNHYIPAITTALFANLHKQHAYRYFMTEQDPVMMELMSRAPVRGSQQSINDLAQRYPMGVTFSSDEELKMLADIGRISDAEFDVIWGCDQASGVTHILDQLALELDDDALSIIVNEKRKIAAATEHVRDYETAHLIYDAEPSWFEDLTEAIKPEPGSREEWLLSALINSNKIFEFYDNGEQGLIPGYYENNRFREEHLKDLCLAKYRQAERDDDYPKALMKFGSWHLYEGLSPTRIHTIGDFFSNVARFNGFESLSINFVSLPEDPEGAMKDIAYAWPFISRLDAEEFAIVDLRPFRHYRNRILLQESMDEIWSDSHKEGFLRLVYGYDLLFYVGKTHAATFTVVPSVN